MSALSLTAVEIYRTLLGKMQIRASETLIEIDPKFNI